MTKKPTPGTWFKHYSGPTMFVAPRCVQAQQMTQQHLEPMALNRARRLIEAGHDISKVALGYDVPIRTLQAQLDGKFDAPVEKAARIKRLQSRRGRRKDDPTNQGTKRTCSNGGGGEAASDRPTADMLADAAARCVAPRSLAAIVFGDPPPGWSALDRRT